MPLKQDVYRQQNRVMETDLSEEAVKERRYLWMARAFALVAVASFLSTIILICALLSLLPIVRVQPFYVTTLNKDEQVIQVQKPKYNPNTLTLLTKSLIRKYILVRFSIGSNVEELERRWGEDGPVHWMSADSVWQGFLKQLTNLEKQARTEGLTRSVSISSLNPLRKDQNEWQAEVTFTDMKYGDSEPIVTKWHAEMTVAFQPLNRIITWEKRLENPLGFTVKTFKFVRSDSQSRRTGSY